MADWPAADLQMWVALRATGGPFDDRGALTHLRASSMQTLQASYGRWLRWLLTVDPQALGLRPEDRATIPRIEAWLSDLAHTRPMSRLAFVQGVIRVLRAWASEHDWSTHRRVISVLKRKAGRGDPDRKKGRILSTDVLLSAGLSYAAPDNPTALTPLNRMLRCRDGAIVALLALMPMRRRSFSELRLGQSVHVRDANIIISLTEDMTKTGVVWEAAVPVQVEPMLRRYITEVRPALLARAPRSHDMLWVGRKGEALTPGAIIHRTRTVTQVATGRRIPPHFFRDAAATTLARLSPEAARLIKPVLGHSGFRTAERHYIHAETIDAGRVYAALVERLKRGK
ncbi:MAG: tyrosine-type recombinase/integrase [Gemmobacter sp.]|nr:tyrosine-type recombinase/integrase [Gemmobacter sp.]